MHPPDRSSGPDQHRAQPRAPTSVYANGWGTTSYTLTGAYWHRRQAVDRYTAKGLETFAADTLTQFRADADARHPAILDAFEVTQ